MAKSRHHIQIQQAPAMWSLEAPVPAHGITNTLQLQSVPASCCDGHTRRSGSNTARLLVAQNVSIWRQERTTAAVVLNSIVSKAQGLLCLAEDSNGVNDGDAIGILALANCKWNKLYTWNFFMKVTRDWQRGQITLKDSGFNKQTHILCLWSAQRTTDKAWGTFFLSTNSGCYSEDSCNTPYL